MSKKLLALLVAVSTCCAFGCSDDDSDSCKMGEKRCDGNNTQICVNGNWSKGTPCADGCDKATGVCKVKEPETGACTTAGEKRCSGKQLQECKDGNWSKLEDCKGSCDEAKKACKDDIPGTTPKVGDPCDKSTFQQVCINGGANALVCWDNVVKQWNCANNDCKANATNPLQVVCAQGTTELPKDVPATCVKGTSKGMCSAEDKQPYICGDKGTYYKGKCESGTCFACSNGWVGCGATEADVCKKQDETAEKCQKGGTAYCQKHCLEDGSKGYYYKQGKVEEVVCAKNDCIINSNKHVVCKSEDNAGGGSGTGGSGDATLPSDVPATCDKNKDKALCSKENGKPYICGDKGTYYQGKCESGSCFVCPDGWVGCGASEEEFCKTHQKPVLPSDVPETCVKGESEAMCSTVDHKPYICGVTGYYQGKCESGSCFKCPDGWVGCGASETEFCKDHQKKADK